MCASRDCVIETVDEVRTPLPSTAARVGLTFTRSRARSRRNGERRLLAKSKNPPSLLYASKFVAAHLPIDLTTRNTPCLGATTGTPTIAGMMKRIVSPAHPHCQSLTACAQRGSTLTLVRTPNASLAIQERLHGQFGRPSTRRTASVSNRRMCRLKHTRHWL